MKPEKYFSKVAQGRIKDAISNPQVKKATFPATEPRPIAKKPPKHKGNPTPLPPRGGIIKTPGLTRTGELKEGWRRTPDGVAGNPVKIGTKKRPGYKAMPKPFSGGGFTAGKSGKTPPGLAKAAEARLKMQKLKKAKSAKRSLTARGTKWYAQ